MSKKMNLEKSTTITIPKSSTRFRPKALGDQVIVITGASSGIGLATAQMAAKRGAKVVLSSRNEKDLKKIVMSLQKSGFEVTYVVADVTRFDDLVRLREAAISRFGRIDTWINNAGGSIYGELLHVPFEEEKQLFETNFWGIRHGCRVAVPYLSKEGGLLINLGSEVSQAPIPLQGMYSATKHAVKAYTDALRMELQHEDLPVYVSLVRPTAIDTPFPEHALNRLRSGEPSLPSPMLHPDVAAEAILKCIEKPTRDVFIGAQSQVMYYAESLFPRLMDIVREKKLFSAQTEGMRIPHTEAYEGLLHPPKEEGKTQGASKGKVIGQSRDASTDFPVAKMVAAAGALAVTGYLVNVLVRANRNVKKGLASEVLSQNANLSDPKSRRTQAQARDLPSGERSRVKVNARKSPVLKTGTVQKNSAQKANQTAESNREEKEEFIFPERKVTRRPKSRAGGTDPLKH